MQKFSPRYVLWLFFSGVGWSLNVCYVHLHNWDNFHIRGMLRFYSPVGSSGGIYCNLRSSTGFAFNFRRLKCGTNRSSGQQFFPCKQTLFDTTKNVCEKKWCQHHLDEGSMMTTWNVNRTLTQAEHPHWTHTSATFSVNFVMLPNVLCHSLSSVNRTKSAAWFSMFSHIGMYYVPSTEPPYFYVHVKFEYELSHINQLYAYAMEFFTRVKCQF